MKLPGITPALFEQAIDFITPLLASHFPAGIPAHIAGAVFKRIPVIISVGADLADGDTHLSTDNLNALNRLILDAKEGRL